MSDQSSESNNGQSSGSNNGQIFNKEDAGPQKTERVVWTNELHQLFLLAINHLPPGQVVPRKILQLMNVRGLTRVNIASHLQKYRKYLRDKAAGKDAPSSSRPYRKVHRSTLAIGPNSTISQINAEEKLKRITGDRKPKKTSKTKSSTGSSNNVTSLSAANNYGSSSTSGTSQVSSGQSYTKNDKNGNIYSLSSNSSTSQFGSGQSYISNYDQVNVLHPRINYPLDYQMDFSTFEIGLNNVNNYSNVSFGKPDGASSRLPQLQQENRGMSSGLMTATANASMSLLRQGPQQSESRINFSNNSMSQPGNLGCKCNNGFSSSLTWNNNSNLMNNNPAGNPDVNGNTLYGGCNDNMTNGEFMGLSNGGPGCNVSLLSGNSFGFGFDQRNSSLEFPSTFAGECHGAGPTLGSSTIPEQVIPDGINSCSQLTNNDSYPFGNNSIVDNTFQLQGQFGHTELLSEGTEVQYPQQARSVELIPAPDFGSSTSSLNPRKNQYVMNIDFLRANGVGKNPPSDEPSLKQDQDKTHEEKVFSKFESLLKFDDVDISANQVDQIMIDDNQGNDFINVEACYSRINPNSNQPYQGTNSVGQTMSEIQATTPMDIEIDNSLENLDEKLWDAEFLEALFSEDHPVNQNNGGAL